MPMGLKFTSLMIFMDSISNPLPNFQGESAFFLVRSSVVGEGGGGGGGGGGGSSIGGM